MGRPSIGARAMTSAGRMRRFRARRRNETPPCDEIPRAKALSDETQVGDETQARARRDEIHAVPDEPDAPPLSEGRPPEIAASESA